MHAKVEKINIVCNNSDGKDGGGADQTLACGDSDDLSPKIAGEAKCP
jgi:hypothetical protein